MVITPEQDEIYKGNKCPYCGSRTFWTSEEQIYGKAYSKNLVKCCLNYPKCDSYVGCHKSGEPKGRLANKQLRNAKKEAHKYFDQLWQGEYITRSEAYKYLSQHLEIPPEYTHIGMFNVATCKKVVEWAKDKLDYIHND